MYLDDGRFSRHPKFIFVLQIILAQKQAYAEVCLLYSYIFMSQVSLTSRRSDNVHRDDLLKALNVNGGEVMPIDLMDYINRNTSLTRTMAGYPGWWNMWRCRLLAMMNQLGPPDVFFTASGADMQWPDGFKYMDDPEAFHNG